MLRIICFYWKLIYHVHDIEKYIRRKTQQDIFHKKCYVLRRPERHEVLYLASETPLSSNKTQPLTAAVPIIFSWIYLSMGSYIWRNSISQANKKVKWKREKNLMSDSTFYYGCYVFYMPTEIDVSECCPIFSSGKMGHFCFSWEWLILISRIWTILNAYIQKQDRGVILKVRVFFLLFHFALRHTGRHFSLERLSSQANMMYV